MKNIIKPLGCIALIIIVCTVTIRLLTNSETLSDYAHDNPEIAYASPEPLPSPTNTPSPTPSPIPTATPQILSAENSFYEKQLTDDMIDRITGISYPVDQAKLAVTYEDLRYLSVLYYNFDGQVMEGELICNKQISEDLLDIFYKLYLQKYPIERIQLIDDYNGDDVASMLANNTSCFNYRVVEGSSSLSKHALGCAIDINPFYNPYIVFGANKDGSDYISPQGSEQFVDRSQDFPHKIDTNDLCYQLFTEHGFTWGGDWKSCKDYQHFQKQ